MPLCSVSKLWTIYAIGLMLIVCDVSARNHHHHVKPLRYSYGIYAPMRWTVALYIGIMIKLGLILGALLLLLFAKKWSTRSQPIIVESGPQFYHHRSLNVHEHNIFRDGKEAYLYWNDRIKAFGEKLKQL